MGAGAGVEFARTRRKTGADASKQPYSPPPLPYFSPRSPTSFPLKLCTVQHITNGHLTQLNPLAHKLAMDLLCHAIGVGSETQDVTADPAPQHQEPACRESASSSRSGPVASEFHPMSPPSRSTPNRQCHVCGRSYERADHLNRHLKSHENARPHKCTHCNKSFNRADLLNRHQAGHSRSAADQRSIERGTRVAAACIACVNAKAKCQDQKPCTRCQLKKIP